MLERALGPQLRATLEGLEVQESSFGDWLKAGGDRRKRARDQQAQQAQQALGFKPTQQVLMGLNAVAAFMSTH